jgi:heme exporter protein A
LEFAFPGLTRNFERLQMSNHVDTRSKIVNEQPIEAAPPICITIDKVSQFFGSRCVFKEISATVSTGQILVVSGANGSGKSTLLRIIAGLLTPSSGRVAIEVGGLQTSAANARQYFGYVAPDLVLYRELTGAENLQFFADLRGLKLDRGALIDLLTRVGLRGRGRDLVGTYSSGMRQRLKYAFALLHNPPILLLDEPTANLDVDGIAIVEQIVAAQQRRAGGGVTVVATNEPREVAWSSLQIHLDAGR